MRKFDYSFLKKGIPGNIVGTIGIISDLNAKNQIRKMQYEQAFEELRKKAIIESVIGSNEIEGIVTTEERIKDLIEGATPVTHDEKEILGYKDALNLIHTENKNLDVSRDVILMFHRMMEENVNPIEAGNFKSRDNLIMEYMPDGSRRVRFNPVKANETEQAIEQLLLAYYDARQDMEIPVLFLIPCFIVDFLCIHPFLDGNGRVSRLLTVLMLYIAGYDIGKYISVENQINEYKESYYAALEQSSDGWHDNKNDYTPFIVNFLQILYKCFKELDESFMDISLKKAKKSERVEAVLMGAVVPISKADIEGKLPDVSVKTIELVLNKMLKDEKIEKIGSYRNARYMKKR
ncbi:Fic family protein [Butyrivibrio proteoclasticus]|uniref:Fic family protein n=1 Tax=Butyrivibrio proteoclasticus TaxID=43305 RepID=A0A1I5TWY2_9FIRM|nr:Fic family protein [Butyrivibrio proteoclasticus]SFP86826.1 Fic family protein [Butyrivibrio proteoclasticus]